MSLHSIKPEVSLIEEVIREMTRKYAEPTAALRNSYYDTEDILTFIRVGMVIERPGQFYAEMCDDYEWSSFLTGTGRSIRDALKDLDQNLANYVEA